MNIIQVSSHGDTIVVTTSKNVALAACSGFICANPTVTDIIEVDIWGEDGYLAESKGFVPVGNELNEIEEWLNDVY